MAVQSWELLQSSFVGEAKEQNKTEVRGIHVSWSVLLEGTMSFRLVPQYINTFFFKAGNQDKNHFAVSHKSFTACHETIF